MLIPGSKDHLNVVTGFNGAIHITERNKVAYGNKVFHAGMTFYDDNGYLYHSDGVKTLAELVSAPIVDTGVAILTAAERKLITQYNKANGLVSTDADNKIDDAQLNLVHDGKIDESYLSNYIENGLIKLEVLPPAVRNHMKYVRTYDQLLQLTGDDATSLVFVMDATGDATVETGWAIYVYRNDLSTWEKIQEGSDIDYDYAALVTHATVEKTGAIMFDHKVSLTHVTLDMLGGLQPPTPATTITSFAEGAEHDLICREGTGAIAARLLTENVIGEHSLVISVKNCTVTGLGDTITDVSKVFRGSVERLNEYLSQAVVQVAVGVVGELTLSVDDGYDTFTCAPLYVSTSDPTLTVASRVVPFNDPSTWITWEGVQLKADDTDSGQRHKVLFQNLPWSSLRLASDGSTTPEGVVLEGTVAEINARLAQGISLSAGNSATHQVLAIDTEPHRIIGTFEVDYTGKIIYPLFATHTDYIEVNLTDAGSNIAQVQQDNVINEHDLTLKVTGDLSVSGFNEDIVTAESGPVRIHYTADLLNTALKAMKITTGLQGGEVSLTINAHQTVVTKVEPINNIPTFVHIDHNVPARHEQGHCNVVLQTEKTRGEHFVQLKVVGCTMSGVGEANEPVGYPVILRGTMEELNEKLKHVVIHMSQPAITGSIGSYYVNLDYRIEEAAMVSWIPEGYPSITVEPVTMNFASEEDEYINTGFKVDLTEVDPDTKWNITFARNPWVQCTLNDGKSTSPDVIFKNMTGAQIKEQLETYGVKFHHVGSYSYQWIGCDDGEHIFTNIASYNLGYTGSTIRWPVYTWWTDSITLAKNKSWSTSEIAIQDTPNVVGEYTILIIPQGDVKVVGMMPDGSEVTSAAQKSFTGTPAFINAQFDKGMIVQGESGTGGTVHIQIGNPGIYHGRSVQVLPK